MSKGPEANLWNTLRQNLPKTAFATRIENVHGGGVPDVHIVWDGMPFWLELKICKANSVKLQSHQIAWNMAYYARNGASFYLVKHLPSSHLYLFGADQGPVLAQDGLFSAQGPRFESAGALFEGLRPLLEQHFEGVLRPSARGS